MFWFYDFALFCVTVSFDLSLHLVSSLSRSVIKCEERSNNVHFCMDWDLKSITQCKEIRRYIDAHQLTDLRLQTAKNYHITHYTDFDKSHSVCWK